MIRTTIRALTVLAILAPPASHAANDWKTGLPIDSIVSLPDGGALLLLPASDPACGSSGNQFHIRVGHNGQTAEGVKSALAVALTAFATGRTVNIVVDTTLAGCPIQMLQINP